MKPANVKITPGGKVKVLDFGLAKAFEPETADANLSNSPTLSMAATNAGVILGTAAYMAPEQAKGRPADRRADIFAFGSVLYEMLTGRRAFGGDDIADILYFEVDPKTGRDLWALDMTEPRRKPRLVAQTPSEERSAQFSPDGRWVAYETNESGRFEIVVQPFPEPTGKWQVSTGGGVAPRWRPDGKELYFIAPDGKLMASAVTVSGATFDAGTAVALFSASIFTGGLAIFKPQYAVSNDGRFLINKLLEDSSAEPITVVLHWNP